MAFTHETPETPPDVHLSEVSSFSARKLSDLHGHIDAPPMARTEVLTWRASDGLEIEGLLTYPADHVPGRSYPMILQVHGGPAGIYAETFTGGPGIYMTQFFADHGYAVLRPNFRGSTGYGSEFRHANVADWGFGDLDDLLTGVDHVIDRGLAHPDSLALMGWSYGGYMTSFAVTRTDRFAAASMGAGLSNLVSMVTTTDISDYLVAHMGGNEYWEDFATYDRHSAVRGIANVVRPDGYTVPNATNPAPDTPDTSTRRRSANRRGSRRDTASGARAKDCLIMLRDVRARRSPRGTLLRIVAIQRCGNLFRQLNRLPRRTLGMP
jgi:dipeptidyl aminopeptidase/acylaminoacyl peptidase